MASAYNQRGTRREATAPAGRHNYHRQHDESREEGIPLEDLQQIIHDRDPRRRQELEDQQHKVTASSRAVNARQHDDEFLMQMVALRSHDSPATNYEIEKDNISKTTTSPQVLVAQNCSNRPEVLYDERGCVIKTPTTISANSLLPGAYPGLPGAVDNQHFSRQDGYIEDENQANHEDGSNVLEGTLEATSKSSCASNKLVIGAIVIVVIALAIAIPTALLTGGSPSENMTQSEADLYLVPNIRNDTIQAIQDPLSPQYFAYEWIEDDPNWNSFPDWRKSQRFGLACLYFACLQHIKVAVELVGWLSYFRDECTWQSRVNQGVCDDRGQYREIMVEPFSNSKVTKASIPPEIFLLSGLEVVSFLGVNLEAEDSLEYILNLILVPFPQYSLAVLRIAQCKLSVTLPTALGLMTSLTLLDLNSNNLQSTIPSELALLTQLEELLLHGNDDLSGTIPEELLELPSLRVLHAGANEIPDSFCEKKNLWANLTLTTNMCNSYESCCCAQNLGDCL
ncbi:Leucine Rich Repeat [Seminavis robusta]|uniref:Leucine Rich Repeat n=1 Tax=Seminavis robusta TaxID=568900 RepID=A0A9N8D946_9STRA|nr:Leucine Rich Repeat [Seminavis robusta]|eukprot:Sro43_g026200.1 Leucine Rich Repeat (510) ;mRNA; r:81448-82977